MSGNIATSYLREVREGRVPVKLTVRPRSYSAVSVVAGLSLFVIGCMATAGAFPHSTMALGGTVVGLGSVMVVDIAIATFRKKEKTKADWLKLAISTIMLTGMITAGALGMGGITNMKQVGWTISGSTAGLLGLLILRDFYHGLKNAARKSCSCKR